MSFSLCLIALGEEVPATLAIEIHRLLRLVWPPAPSAPPLDEEQLRAHWPQRQEFHVIKCDEEGRVLAHAGMFKREIITLRGPLAVGALGGVCVHPDFRGRGWGAGVVREVFRVLPQLNAPVSLFQTGVPEFYERLGARRVSNRFFNRDHSVVPFWDTHTMIYPAHFDWPGGDVDLNGPGY